MNSERVPRPTLSMEGFEERLNELREEARERGRVEGTGVDVAGGPIPAQPQARPVGYAGEPIVKPPVWTWEIPVYFFVGGLAGMSAVVACGAGLSGHMSLMRAALWIAFAGALISPALLVMDLGRPRLFLNMLRVFKISSPMSMGAWILSAYGAHVGAVVVAFELAHHHVASGMWQTLLNIVTVLAVAGAGFWGVFLATYTGVLIGATTIPAWFLHRITLPIHFGTVGLGCAVGLLELFGYRDPALAALGLLTAGIETVLWVLLEFRKHGAADRAVHSGKSGWMIRISDWCTGPVTLLFRVFGWRPVAAVVFLAGGLLSRFGWIEAGRASGRDPESVLASQSRG